MKKGLTDTELVERQKPIAAQGGLWGWLDGRLGLAELRYKVPAHANTIWYTLGGISFVGIVVLIVTGVLLARFYNPDPSLARESVIAIQNTVPLGDVIRGIHVWTAYLVVITAALHLIRIFVTASYKIPREVNWLLGLGLLVLLMFGAVFSGTVLRWDQEAFEAMNHNMELTSLLGSLGGTFSDQVARNVPMLHQIYLAHVSIVPILIVALTVVHIFLIKTHGISPTSAQADAGEAPDGELLESHQTGNYAAHFRLMVGYGLVLLGLAGALGVIFPAVVGPAADPTLEITKPPFIFYWLYAFEDWFKSVKGIFYAAISVFGLLALLPFLDRSPWRNPRRRPIVMALGALVLVGIIVLSIMVGVSPVARHL